MRRALRRYARRDSNEPELVEFLKVYGFSIIKHSGRDEPDLVLGKGGLTRVVEVKRPGEDLKPGQAEFWQGWRGNGKIVLYDVDDATALLRYWDKYSADLGQVIALERERRGRGEGTGRA